MIEDALSKLFQVSLKHFNSRCGQCDIIAPVSYTHLGEKSACNPYKNLTYEKMERFMDAIPNGAEYRKQYDFLKAYASGIQTNAYSTMREWFIAQFPLYRKNPLFYLTETPKIISGIDFAKQQAEAAEEKKNA